MAIELNDQQKLIKKQEDDLKKRQQVITFPTNIKPGQQIPLMKTSNNPPPGPQVGQPPQPGGPPTGQDVVSAAQQKALGGFQTPIQERLDRITGQIMDLPERDVEGQTQAALSQFDVGKSKAIEEFRRQTGGVAGSSDRQAELLGRHTQGALERAQLGSDLRAKGEEQKRQDLLTSFDIGSKAVGQKGQEFRSDIDTLLKTAEGAREYDALGLEEKLTFAELASREKIQLNDQQFQTTQSALRQNHELALQNNDIEAARTALQADLDFRSSQAELGREFTEEQRALDRTLQESLAHLDIDGQREMLNLRADLDEGLLITQQQFAGAQAALDRAQEESQQQARFEQQQAVQAAQQQFQSSEEALSRALQIGMQSASFEQQNAVIAAQQQFQSTQTALERAQQTALQDSSIAAQQALQVAQQQHQTSQAGLDRAQQATMQNQSIAAQQALQAAQQQHQASQAGLDRAQQMDLGELNIQAQRELQDAQNQFNELMQNNQQRWQSSERSATQAWQSSERLSEESHQQGLQYIDHQNRLAIQNNDINGQRTLQDMRSKLELKLQYQDMQFDEARMRLDADLSEARAQNDDARMSSVMQYQHELDMRRLKEQGNQAEALALVNGRIEENLQQGNFKNAQIMQQVKFGQEMEMAVYNRAMQEAELKLQERGLDLNETFNNWNILQQSIASGQAAPESAFAWLQQNLPPEMAKIVQAPDPYAIQKAIQEDFLNQQMQFANTHTGSAVLDANGNFTGLTEEAQLEFNEWFNTNFYENEEAVNTSTGLIFEAREEPQNVLDSNSRPPGSFGRQQ